MKISDQYKFYLAFPDEAYVEVFPENLTLEWKYEKNSDYGFEHLILESKLIFKNNIHNTFDRLYEFEKDRNNCNEIGLKISVRYDHVNWVHFWDGYLPSRAGDWNLSHKRVDIKPRANDIFRCIIDNGHKEYNLLEIPDKSSISTLIGIQECTTVIAEYNGLNYIGFGNAPYPSPPSGYGWLPKEETKRVTERYEYADGDIYQQYGHKVTDIRYEVIYCREVYNDVGTPQQGLGWKFEGGKYVRPLALSSEKIQTFETTGVVIGSGTFDTGFDTKTITTVITREVVNINADNMLQLTHILDFLLPDCNISWKSDFFNIDPDNTHPNNQAYDYSENYLQGLLFAQASDVVRASAANNATIFKMSLKNLFRMLKLIFQVEMILDGNNIRIEHISYQNNKRMLNLVDTDSYKFIRDKAYFSYTDNDFPRVERFSWKYKTGSDDFDKATIEYDPSCSSEDENNEVEHIANLVVTNVAYLYNNEDLISDIDKLKDTMVIVSSGNGSITSLDGPISKKPLLNGAMAWSNIIQNLWLWERPLIYGLVNGSGTSFRTRKATRKQKEFTIDMTLNDFVTKYNPKDRVKTQLGWGVIEDAKYTSPRNALSLTLKFP